MSIVKLLLIFFYLCERNEERKRTRTKRKKQKI